MTEKGKEALKALAEKLAAATPEKQERILELGEALLLMKEAKEKVKSA